MTTPNAPENSEKTGQLVPSPAFHPEVVKITIIGSPQAVKATIHQLHRLGFAEVTLWSPLQPTGKLNEVISLLVRKIWLR
ncbi:peptide ABC transporter substrate-binding protein [Oscillatoria sp. FACHB-1406]|nr:peptide ABC transporter substrate-binding protein [Oscillatoria sp. FACHB-1406]